MQDLAKNRAWIEVHLATLLFGFAGLFGKLVQLPALWIVFGRAFFAALALIGVALVLRHTVRLRSARDLFWLSLLGGLLALHWWSFFYAIQISTVAVGLLSFASFPLFITLLEPLVFKEKLALKNVVTALLTVLGLVLVVPDFNLQNNLTQGVLWGVLSGATFALISLLNRRFIQTYDGAVVSFYQNFIAALVLLPFLILMPVMPSAGEWAQLILLGIVFTAVAHTLFIRSMRSIRAQQASIIVSLEPVYGVLFAAVLLSEYPGVRMLVGGGLILTAAVLTMRAKA